MHACMHACMHVCRYVWYVSYTSIHFISLNIIQCTASPTFCEGRINRHSDAPGIPSNAGDIGRNGTAALILYPFSGDGKMGRWR